MVKHFSKSVAKKKPKPERPEGQPKTAGGIWKWRTPGAMQKVVDEYFASTPKEEWTVSGLAVALGSSRKILIHYQQRDGYSEVINRAKSMIEREYEISLRRNGRAGDIFALKNFGWADRQEWTGADGGPIEQSLALSVNFLNPPPRRLDYGESEDGLIEQG